MALLTWKENKNPMSNHVAPILGSENLVTSLDKDWYAHRLILLAQGRCVFPRPQGLGGGGGGEGRGDDLIKQNFQLET